MNGKESPKKVLKIINGTRCEDVVVDIQRNRVIKYGDIISFRSCG